MTRWHFVVLTILSTGSPALAQMAEQEVTRAEQARLEARRKADSATLGRLSSDDVLLISPTGQLVDKKGAAALSAQPKIAARETRTQMFGDVAVVTGIQSGMSATGDQEQRFTRVWQKQNGQWVNVFGQVTRIVPPTPAPPAQPPPASSPAPTKWPAGASQDERDVLKVQRGLNDTFAKKDAATYATMTADSFTRINLNGSVSTRAEFLKAVAATPETKRVESNNTDFRFRAYGPVAVLTFIDRAAGGPPAGNRMTRVYVREGGTWKQLLTQQTPIAQQ